MNIGLDRREFLFGSLAAAAGGCVAMKGGEGGVDPNLSAFLSDIHVGSGAVKMGEDYQPTYQNAYFKKAVDKVLSMPVRPARAVIFGDVALWTGHKEDYLASLPGIKCLEDAGIKVHLALGNHDRRDTFFEVHPEYAKSTPVAGRVVSAVDLGTADLFLMDSLDQTGAKPGEWNRVGGAMDDAQAEWLIAKAKAATRPFFVGAHHDPRDLNGRKILKPLMETEHFTGWIHGHDHNWSTDWYMKDWGSRKVVRAAVLPSTGWWGDIGFGLMRTGSDQAELTLEQYDFYFPRPLDLGEKKPEQWEKIVQEHQGYRCSFVY